MLSVILPTKNEPLINELIVDIHKVLENEPHEIIVVDLSDSPPQIDGATMFRQKSAGLGNAVLEGVKNANGDKILVMDADFSHDPKDIPGLLQALNKHDFVIGSRYCTGGETRDNKRRYGVFPNSLVSKIYCSIASSLLGLGLKDPMNGFAAAKRDVYSSVSLNPRGYKIHMETAFKAKKKGFTIGEVPTTFYKRRAGNSNTGMGEAFRTMRFIFELWLGLR